MQVTPLMIEKSRILKERHAAAMAASKAYYRRLRESKS